MCHVGLLCALLTTSCNPILGIEDGQPGLDAEKLNNSALCSVDAECQSGVCAEGVCCDVVCTEICMSCAAPGSLGTCSPLAPASTDEGCADICDGSGRCTSGAPQSAVSYGSEQLQRARSLHADATQGLVLAGEHWGSVSYGGETLTSMGMSDMLVVQFDTNKQYKCSRLIGGMLDETAVAARWGNGAVFALGSVLDALSGARNGFLLQLNDNCDVVNQLPLSSDTQLIPRALDMFSDGGMVVAGEFDESISVGGYQAVGTNDGFLVAIESTLDVRWGHKLSGEGVQQVMAVAVGPGDELAACGTLSGKSTFEGVELKSTGGTDVFVLKLTREGEVLWGKTFGGTGDQTCRAVAMDHAGHILVAGDFDTVLGIGNETMLSSGRDAYIAKLDGFNGQLRWVRQLAGNGDVVLSGISVDDLGNSLIAGHFSGELVGAGSITAAGEDDALVLKLARTGEVLWLHALGDGTTQTASSVALSSTEVLVSGTFTGQLLVGQTRPIDSPLNASIFIASFEP